MDEFGAARFADLSGGALGDNARVRPLDNATELANIFAQALNEQCEFCCGLGHSRKKCSSQYAIKAKCKGAGLGFVYGAAKGLLW